MSCLLVAQDNQFVWSFSQLTRKEGLINHQYNSFITTDSRGFTWISSLKNINRFDGLNVKIYAADYGLGEQYVQSKMYEDGKGDLWFSTYQALLQYDYKLDSFEKIQLTDQEGKKIEENYKVIYIDKTHNKLWLRAGSGIYSISTHAPYAQHMQIPLVKGHHFSIVSSIEETPNQILASPLDYEDGLNIYSRQADGYWVLEKFLLEIGAVIKTIPLEKNNWLVCTRNNLYIFNTKKTNDYITLNNPERVKIEDVTKISSTQFSVSSRERGVWKFNLNTQKWKSNFNSHLLPEYQSLSERPRSLAFTIENTLWVEHLNQGLNYLPLTNNNFQSEDFLTDEIVSLNIDKNQFIWATTAKNGVFQYQQNGELVKHFSPAAFGKEEIYVHKLIQVDTDILCTGLNDIFKLNTRENRFKPISNPQRIKTKIVDKIYPDRILVSTNKGLKELIKDNQNYQWQACKEFTEYQDFKFFQWFQSKKNIVYLPYNISELWIYQAKMAGLELMKKIDCNTEFYSFIESEIQPNTIYAGTSKGIMEIVNDTILQPTSVENELLKNTQIYSLIEDQHGGLWSGTDRGLCYLASPAASPVFFETEDGLPTNSFSHYHAAIKTKDQQIWMGTKHGLIQFYPDSIRPYHISPKVYVERLVINNKEELKGIGEIQQLELPYHKNTLYFEVPAIGYYKAKRSKVNYQLKGYDEDWLSVKNGQPIRFTKLPHGHYTFRVQAEDVNGNKSEIRELAIQITPPFWRTWWFYLLCLVVALSLIYVVYKYRVAQIHKEAEKKTAIARLELQVLENELKALRAQMNPHFLFNTMNSIKGIIIKQETKKAIEYLTKLSFLIRAILSNSERKTISLAKELEALKLYMDLESLRFTQIFNYQIQIDKNVDQSFVHIPPLVLQPFVENAIWHGLLPKENGRNQLTIRIFRKDDFVLCEIEDNGVGRKVAQQSKIKKKHQSMGIGITTKRVQLLHPDNRVDIIDLVDENQRPTGTKVILELFAPD